MGLQRVGHDWATELNWTELSFMDNARLYASQPGIKIARRNTNNLRHADDTTLITESEEQKSLLMRVKEESEEAVLKLHIKKY